MVVCSVARHRSAVPDEPAVPDEHHSTVQVHDGSTVPSGLMEAQGFAHLRNLQSVVSVVFEVAHIQDVVRLVLQVRNQLLRHIIPDL